MSPTASPALEVALAARGNPVLYAPLRAQPLPAGVLLLLRVLARDSAACVEAERLSGERRAVVEEASALFAQQLMFHPDCDSFRVLGAAAHAGEDLLREHRRWLLRWLHPDRNANDWEAVYADRVGQAWQDLRTAQRRADYERRTQAIPMAPLKASLPVVLVRTRPQAQAWDIPVSPRTARRLPVAILGGLGALCATVLAVQYAGRDAAHAEPAAIVVGETDSAAIAPAEVPAPKAPREPLTVPTADEPVGDALATGSAAAFLDTTRPPGPVVAPSALQTADPAPMTASLAARPRKAAPAVATPPRAAVAPVSVARAAPAAPVPVTVHDPASARVVDAPAKVLALSAPPSAAPSVVPELINEASARSMLARFGTAYASGKLSRIRALLPDRVAGSRRERDAILRNYHRLFQGSAQRRIELHEPVWLTDGDTAIVLARYEAWVQPVGGAEDRYFSGDIRFDLQAEDGELRIARLRHGDLGEQR